MTGAAEAVAPAASPTRARLLAAARAVIEVHGYGGASVLAIAGEAGVAAGTLYRHFPSKADLFVEVFRDVCSRELRAAREAAEAHAGAPVAAIDATIQVFAERALLGPTLTWALIAEPVDPAVEAVRLEFRAEHRETIAALLRSAIAAGDVPVQDPGLTAAALVGAANEVLAGPLAPARDGQRPAPETVRALRDLWRRTIGAA